MLFLVPSVLPLLLAAQTDTTTTAPASTDLVSTLLNILQSGGPLGFAAICLVALIFVARSYVGARDQKDGVLQQWNSESKNLIVESTEASIKTAEALNAVPTMLTQIYTKLTKISERLSRLEDKLDVKRYDNDE